MASPVSSMAEKDKKKGILKHAASYDDPRVVVHWDEMNIMQTYHPEGKDYGHMKIKEPPTPYSYANEDSDTECDSQKIDPQKLAERMKNVPAEGDKHPHLPSDESCSDEEMSPEQREIKKAFRSKRKQHYNEYGNVKLARELIEKELAELEDDDDNSTIQPQEASKN